MVKSVLKYKDSGLTCGSTYEYKVRAIAYENGVKYKSSYSSVVSVKPVPATVKNVKAVGTGYDSADITWSKVSGVTGYYIYRSSGSSYSQIGRVTGSGTLKYSDSGLKAGTEYKYKVRAYKTVSGKDVKGEYSASASAVPLPSAPASVKAEASAYNKITVSWDKVNGASGYYLYCSTSPDSGYSVVKTVSKGSTTSYTNRNRLPGVTYYYKVSAYTTTDSVKYEGAMSAYASAKTKPDKVSSITAESRGYDSVKVSWTAADGATGYVVYMKESGSSYKEAGRVTSGTSMKIYGLTAGTEYSFKVKTYITVNGTNVYSSSSSSVKCTPVPSATKLSLSKSGTTAVLDWKQVSGAGGYEIYRSTDGKAYSKLKTIRSGATVTYTDSKTKSGVRYYYKIRAFVTVNGERIYSDYSSVKNIRI